VGFMWMSNRYFMVVLLGHPMVGAGPSISTCLLPP
jgi:hypothetical protein